MYSLRPTRRIAGLVLAWFVVFVAAAGIAPWMQAQPMQDVCSASGVPHAGKDGSAADRHAGHAMECALCTGVSGPPLELAVLPEPPQPLAHALRPVVAATIAALAGAPLPARGPPSLS